VINSVLFLAWASAIALFDCRARRVPNSLVIVGLLLACLQAVFGRSPFEATAGAAMLGVVVGFVALLPFYFINMMGAGDVKVFAVLGAWCGVHALPGLWIAASLTACAYVLFTLACRMAARAISQGRSDAVLASLTGVGRRGTPYAAFLAASAAGYLMLHAGQVAS
jgi:prepilin peptidase CpaA